MDSHAYVSVTQPEREPPIKVDATLEKDLHYLAKSAHAMSMPTMATLGAGPAPPSYPKLLGGFQQQKPV